MWPVVLIFGLFSLIGAAFDAGEKPSRSFAGEPVQSARASLVVTGKSVNLRSGPGTSYAVIGQLRADTRVQKVSDGNGWTQISSSFGTGWMSSRYLKHQGSGLTSSVQTNRRSLQAADIRVIDGDTVGIRGQAANVRLVGFNAPETRSPKCSAEKSVGLQATARLRALIGSAQSIELERVACACRQGTEGTRRCNYGRQCGILKTNGNDVGRILISEGLAVRYICGRTSCPRRPGNWCR
ncbi:SH3 domain-containing protein [Tritonibacter mobilis]|uniref:SH3 domain-containing protein n=1 Tax=Tritonibacter mobilis TaxID=379347 RepID=UPI001CD96972|nr:SH3 domain-containing protein [Tritonibacter mobilis]